MSPSRSREFILVFTAVVAVGVGSLLVAGSALAEGALFRVEHRWHNFPNPPVTPGGAGLYQGYVFPYYLDTPAKNYLSPPATATVAPGNPIGGHPEDRVAGLHHDVLLSRLQRPREVRAELRVAGFASAPGLPDHGGEPCGDHDE